MAREKWREREESEREREREILCAGKVHLH